MTNVTIQGFREFSKYNYVILGEALWGCVFYVLETFFVYFLLTLLTCACSLRARSQNLQPTWFPHWPTEANTFKVKLYCGEKYAAWLKWADIKQLVNRLNKQMTYWL